MSLQSTRSIVTLLGILLSLGVAYAYWSDHAVSRYESRFSAPASMRPAAPVQSSLSSPAIAADTSVCATYRLELNACSGETELLPWGQDSNFVWNVAELNAANNLLRDFGQVLDAFGPEARAGVTPLFEISLRNALARSRDDRDARPLSGTTALRPVAASEVLLATRVQSFRLALDLLVHLNTALREAGFRAVQTDLETVARNYALARVDDVQQLAESAALFSPRSESSAVAATAAQTHAQRLFGVTSPAELADYVQAQLMRLNVLADYALPPVVYLLNTSGAVGTENVRLWSGTLTELDNYNKGTPDNQVAALENFILQTLSQPVSAGCPPLPAADTDSGGSDWYTQTRRRLAEAVLARCR